MLYIRPFKMVPSIFLFMQHDDFIYSAKWERIFHVPNVAKLKAVVNVLQRTYFKT